MKFKINFANPYDVSQDSFNLQTLNITLIEDVFFAADTLEPISGTYEIPLPQQYEDETQKIITESIGTSFQFLMGASMLLSFILQFW